VRPFVPEMMSQRIDHKARVDLRDWFAAEFDAAGLRRRGLVGQAMAWTIHGPAFLAHLLGLADEDITIYSTPQQLAARPPGAGRRA